VKGYQGKLWESGFLWKKHAAALGIGWLVLWLCSESKKATISKKKENNNQLGIGILGASIKWHCFASGKWCVSGKWCFSASGNWAPQKKQQLTSWHFLKVGITVLPESEICSSSGICIAVLVLDVLDLSGIAI